MVDVEEVSDADEEQRQQNHGDEEQLGSDYENVEAEDGGEYADAGAEGGGGGGMPAGFQQLLQLASHLKSAQPEVREKRERWERLALHQKNSVLFQQQDAAVRYDLLDSDAARARLQEATATGASSAAAADASAAAATVPSTSRFDSVRFPLAQALKTRAGALFRAGSYSEASLAYQRAIGLFQWARKYSTKDGDEIEWEDLLAAPNSDPEAERRHSEARKAPSHPGASVQELEAAAAADAVFRHPIEPLTPEQRTRAVQLVFTCLVNIAACEEKQQEWQHVIAVCEAALAMDMRSSAASSPEKQDASAASSSPASSTEPAFNLSALTLKALYRCASAYNKLDELEKAIALLQRASRLAPRDAKVASELASLREQTRIQAQKDKKSFGGLFERGEIFEGDDVQSAFEGKAAASSSAAAASSASASSTAKDAMPSDERTKAFMAEYLTGFREQARREKAGKNKSNSKSAAENDEDVDADLDTSRPGSSSASSSSSSSSRPAAAAAPSPEHLAAMYADARARFGLDLSDPLVQEELRRLQQEHASGGIDAAVPAASSSSKRSAGASSTRSKGISSSAAGAMPPPGSLDSSGQGGWIGPVIFFVLLAAALRWMKIM